MKTKVLYWWIGKVKWGYFVGYKNGRFLIEDSERHYDTPVQTGIIYPYVANYVGWNWEDSIELKEALREFLGRDYNPINPWNV